MEEKLDHETQEGKEIENATPSTSEEEPAAKVTPKTWVVVFILGMGYGLSFWPIPVFAAIQSEVAAEMGEPSQYIWFIPAWSLAITVCFLIAGANTDLLGRRWFLVGGNLICFVGQLVVATSKSTAAVTVGMAVVGFGAACCQMAAFAVGELLPNKWRHLGVVFADLATLVAVTVGPITARYGIVSGTWRLNFYSAAIFQALSFFGLYFLYYPPKHPQGLPYAQVFREMDYIGMVLFIAGAAPLLAGIIYSTSFPASDPHIVAPLVVGAAVLVLFALWENIGFKRGLIKHPLTPTRVFTSGYGRDLTAPCIGMAVINMFYYSSSILWPTMINVFYVEDPSDWQYASLLSVVQGLAILTGVAFLAFFGSVIKRWNWQLAGYTTTMVVFGVLLALGTPSRKAMMIVFVFISQAAYGAAMYLCIAVSQMGVDQEDLGLSGGLGGTSRFAGGAIATAVYTAVLTQTVKKWTAKLVPVAVLAAGLPDADLTSFMSSLGTPALTANFSSEVVAAAGKATQGAYQHGIQITAFTSLAFGMVGIIACLLCKDIEPKMTDKIEIYMENTELAGRNKFH